MASSVEHHIFSIETVEQLAQQHFGLSAAAKMLPGYLDLNYYLKANDGEEYILKIAHVGEKKSNLEMQNAMLQHLENKDLGLPLPKVIRNDRKQTIIEIEDNASEPRLLRLLTWVPGQIWATANPISTTLRHQLGQAVARVDRALLDFDHPSAHSYLEWDLSQALWIKNNLQYIETEERKAMLTHFITAFEEEVLPAHPTLRKSIIHGDVNDYNIIIHSKEEQKTIGLFDFGDAVYTHTINELAIAAAYIGMSTPDPLAAVVDLVTAYHGVFPIEEKELKLLYTLIAMRLCVTVSAAAHKRHAEPENAYLLVSEQPAWEVLEKWNTIDSNFAHYTFRNACGFEACPKQSAYKEWISINQPTVVDVLKIDWEQTPFRAMDLSIGSLDLGNNDHFSNPQKFSKKVNALLAEEEVEYGIGGYLEVRPFYTTDAYQVKSNNGPKWRTVHLGLDIWAKAGTPVYAPIAGKVFSVYNNAGTCNYGPTLILEHQVNNDLTFYTLYGHLSLTVLDELEEGQPIQKGRAIATIGPSPENGEWPPHLHFQIMLDMLSNKRDFPGVAFPIQVETWKSICPDPNLFLFGKTARVEAMEDNAQQRILESRKAHLGPNLSLSYQKPLHMVRAFKQYLYDHTARRYLDTANNVPHVGHQHPRVVRAAQKQMELINTNTRYLHDNIVAYAEELLATFPPELDVCFFVNSGSEANELALRMARTYTGQKDMLAVEVGYHGNTSAVIDVSSYKFDGKGGMGAPKETHLVPIPDVYRGIYRGDAKIAGQKYAQHIGQNIENLKTEGKGIAGFICESMLSCGGQIVLPPGYLKTAFAQVHAAGGLCIMDEVQVGFGRMGDHFWGFEFQDVVPDIVTMGKPIGNGHPLAAVVTSRKVADAFANGMEYFNTFGGNPVSCSIGREVLQIVKDEKLQANAKKIGTGLTAGLQQLQQQFPIIGDVRGPGLFLGFEMVRDHETLEPADRECSYLANRMKERGILMSTDGPFHNVIKIKPPMCFNEANVDFLLEELGVVLKEDFFKRR